MAGASKKLKKVSKPDSDEEYQSDDESETYNGPQEIQATFEGRNPEGQDFHGIKQLLQQLFPTAHLDLGQMSDMLIAQAGVGSVLKQSCNDSDDDEDIEMVEESDVFGITSVVNLTSHKESPCVLQLHELIDEESKKNAEPTVQAKFKEILNSSNKIGFIINERFVNIPSKISSLMLTSLQDEVERIQKKDASYKFEYFLMLCKIWKPKGNKNGEVTFSNDEEEIFHKKADCFFDYSVAGKSDTGLSGHWKTDDTELVPYRRVILFKSDKFNSILSEIQNFVMT